jgi:tetratricopeptide (TPR) repeat protein
MTRQQQLKNEARRAEHRSDWARAIELYKSAIRLEQESGSVSDVGVYNRVGDLYLRRGDTTAAVEYYEQAADHYAAHGLHTSAIALCNKVLRIAPERDEVYRRLARLHASTGLLAEARNAFLQFAQRMQDRDRLSEALEAIQELVGLTGAEELRTAFAGQLEAAGLASQAAAQLRLVYEARIAAGRNAQDIRERIVALDPAADPVTPAEAPSPRAVSTTPGPQRSAEEPPDEMRDLRAPGTPLPVDLGPTSPEPARDELQLEGPSTEVAAVSDAEVIPGADDDLASILSRFRSHVRGIVKETDHAVHYDLGVAYMGMGLLDEAIGEFQHAIHSPSLMEAAHALLGECLRSKASAKSSEAAPPATPPAVQPLAPPADRSTGTEVPTVEDDEGEDLAEQMFQARLAQHRVRRAAEQAKADHQAHLDLARAYEGMGLLLEAVRDYVAAAEGPGSVRDAALDALELLASSASVDAVALSEAMEALMAEGRDETAVDPGSERPIGGSSGACFRSKRRRRHRRARMAACRRRHRRVVSNTSPPGRTWPGWPRTSTPRNRRPSSRKPSLPTNRPRCSERRRRCVRSGEWKRPNLSTIRRSRCTRRRGKLAAPFGSSIACSAFGRTTWCSITRRRSSRSPRTIVSF